MAARVLRLEISGQWACLFINYNTQILLKYKLFHKNFHFKILMCLTIDCHFFNIQDLRLQHNCFFILRTYFTFSSRTFSTFSKEQDSLLTSFCRTKMNSLRWNTISVGKVETWEQHFRCDLIRFSKMSKIITFQSTNRVGTFSPLTLPLTLVPKLQMIMQTVNNIWYRRCRPTHRLLKLLYWCCAGTYCPNKIMENKFGCSHSYLFKTEGKSK